MPPQNGRQPRDICGVDGIAIGVQFFDCGLHVDGIPVSDGVQREPQRAELLFLPLSQRVANLSPVTVIDFSGKLVAEFLTVQLNENAAAELSVVDVVQDVQCFNQTAEMHERLGKCCWTIPHLKNAHDTLCLQVPELQGTREADQVFPVVDDQLDVDRSFRDCPKGAIVGGFIDPP